MPFPSFIKSMHAASLTLLALLAAPVAHAQTTETITAVAEVKSAGGVSVSAPVVLAIARFSSDADRSALVNEVKSGGTELAQRMLSKRDDVGTLKVGAHTAAVKYAFARATGDGRLITAITSEPLVFLGAGVPGAKSTTGYSLGLVLIELNGKGTGSGELIPAGLIRAGDQDSIVTEAYNAADVVRLSNVARK